MALATVSSLSFAYPEAEGAALENVAVDLREGEVVALLGPSGSGKSTLLRALAGLVPHFHGGRFRGTVVVAGRDTRRTRPADLVGTVATVFQDPEDQVVMTRVANEVAFGLENTGVPPAEIWPRVEQALDAVDAFHLAGRRTAELSGGELQRVCLASALALRPSLLLLDEPTSQLDPYAADRFLDAAVAAGTAVVLSEHRIGRALRIADRVLYLERGIVLLDAPRTEAIEWLSEHRPAYANDDGENAARSAPHLSSQSSVVNHEDSVSGASDGGVGRTPVVRLAGVRFAYPDGPPVLTGVDLELRGGEIVALEGPNGSGKSTLAKLAAGLLEPAGGSVERAGRAAYLSQDPGRYLVRERCLDEVALGVRGDRGRALGALERVGLAWAADRHPRDLSSGERQRLALAAVAVSEPRLLVLDEPTRGLDPDRKDELVAWIDETAAAGTAVLLATHDRSFPAHRRIAVGAGAEAPVAL